MPFVAILIAYLAGSIPFGLLAGFLAGKDIRTEGSGNIGATNVLRVCGAKWGVPALLLDALKGFAPVFWGGALLGVSAAHWLVAVGIAAILGHNFPVWLKFKGGKGVATSAGVVLALLPAALGVAVLVFFVVVLITRYVSLGSMLGSVAMVIAHCVFDAQAFTTERLPLTILAFLLCAMVVLRHRANITRLRAGTENKIFAKKTAAVQPADEMEGAAQ